MRPYRNTDVLQDAMVFLNGAVIDRDARIVDGFMNHSGWIRLRRPFEIIQRFGPIPFTGGIYLVDGNDFARLGFGKQVLVVDAPPCRSIAAKRLARIFWIGARPRRNIDDPQLNHVALLGAADVDRSGENMHAQAFASTATEQRSIHRTRPTSVDTLLL